jgi:UDP-glucose 4-epimerase
MAKVAVTGGAGFIGSNLVTRLISEGHQVTVIDDLSTGLVSNINNQDCIFNEISITDISALETAISKCETIFHFGARGSVPRSILNPVATHNVNATGTLNVLEVARKSGAHIVFSSSSSVYGRNNLLPKRESMWLGPTTPYAASKLAAEAYIQSYSSTFQIPATIFRFFNVFGPRQRPDHEYAAVIPKWIWLAMNDKPIEVYGDGTVTRDFTYIETVIDVAMAALNGKVTTQGAVNLAYGSKISLNEIINQLKEHFPKLKVNYKENRFGDVRDSQNSPELLIKLFPNVVPRPFKDSLELTISWIEKFGHLITKHSKTLS